MFLRRCRLGIAVLIVSLSLSLSGCATLIIGSIAAAGGYAISQDTIQGETEKDFETVWQSAVDIVSIMGTISSQSQELGRISGIVNGAKITVHVTQLTSSTIRVKVKARKALFPSIANAQNIFIKIVNRANE